jgi:glycerol-3-phosphate acyltransferase PlsX
MSKSKLAVDLMGGDLGPKYLAKGLIASAIAHPDVTYYAVALPHVLSQCLATRPQNIEVIPAEHEITMHMSVSEVVKIGASSSMGTAIQLVAEDRVDACVSCGNTVGLMTLAFKMLRMQPGIRRPALLSSIQFNQHRTYLTDLGTNILPKPEDFLDNARLAVDYISVENPKIAILNIGREPSKGTPLVKEAAKLLISSELNYVGFAEGHDILSNQYDIILSDGFVGNCITKFMESMLSIFCKLSPDIANTNKLPKINYAALFAGLNGRVYKTHGHSTAQIFSQALEDIISQEQLLISAE